MKILLTNDDGYRAGGLLALAEILRPYGDLTVVAPKYIQSATSMAVTMGYRPIAVKRLPSAPCRPAGKAASAAEGEKESPVASLAEGLVTSRTESPAEEHSESWWYVDGSPASCVKFALTEIYGEDRPDIVVSGINHGGNYATAALYSGTLGAAAEAALVRIPAIGVSIDDPGSDPDFSVVKAIFPGIFGLLARNPAPGFGIYYNINFPAVPPGAVRGVKVAEQGIIRWVREFSLYDYGMLERRGIDPSDIGLLMPRLEEGETPYLMTGEVTHDPGNTPECDVNLIARDYVTVTAHNLMNVDAAESERLRAIGLEMSGSF